MARRADISHGLDEFENVLRLNVSALRPPLFNGVRFYKYAGPDGPSANTDYEKSSLVETPTETSPSGAGDFISNTASNQTVFDHPKAASRDHQPSQISCARCRHESLRS